MFKNKCIFVNGNRAKPTLALFLRSPSLLGDLKATVYGDDTDADDDDDGAFFYLFLKGT